MKKHILFFLLISFHMITIGQETKKAKLKYDPKKETYQAEAACGMCIYKMKGDGCKLAIRMNQKDFLVDGTDIDDYGDAHDQEGFCNAASNVKVQGRIVGDRFLVTYMELVKKEEKK